MRFCVVAYASVPDVPTARRVLDLDGLDNKSVAKVVFHNRKQQTRGDESLRWDQFMLAGMTLIQHSVDTLRIESMQLGTHSEADMLNAYFTTVLRNGCAVTWDGMAGDLTLLHYRALQQSISYPAYWQGSDGNSVRHLDIVSQLAPRGTEMPSLDALARNLDQPGILGYDRDTALRAWIDERYDEVSACSDIAALNVYLLALRFFAMTGEITRADDARAKVALRDALKRQRVPHYTAFNAAWSTA